MNLNPSPETLTPYSTLSPSLVLMAAESVGYKTTGRVIALNSYENRVYQVEVDEGERVVLKFYRPGRWTVEQIKEEHQFSFELEDEGVFVVAPLEMDGESLFECEGFLFSIYDFQTGRTIELGDSEDYREMGRAVARIHAVGEKSSYRHRLTLDVETYGWQNLSHLRASQMVPAEMMAAYDLTVTQLLTRIEQLWRTTSFENIRIHGDAHLGNILSTQGQFVFLDLDDSLMGPSIQDIWLFVDGIGSERARQLGLLIEGYREIRAFDLGELQLIEALRALRMIHYTAWIAKRWVDPTFPVNFQHFTTVEYWQSHLQSLKDQMLVLDDPVLVSI